MYTPSGYSTLPWYRWPIEIDDVPSYKSPRIVDFPWLYQIASGWIQAVPI